MCGAIDRQLGYPGERGAVYSALFGISRAEGCRRVAEMDIRVYADLLSHSCHADALLGFVALIPEISTAVLAWVAAGSIGGGRLVLRRVGAVLGFFVALALLNAVTRAVVIKSAPNLYAPADFQNNNKIPDFVKKQNRCISIE
jgi:hypothetical protein